MYNPISTYRIQFNKNFRFQDFKDKIEYFTLLGVGTIYSSPLFTAAPGSLHGYDVTNPFTFNPEIGGESEFNDIINDLKNKSIGWILDIVPNHMAVHIDNPWLVDVLKNGSESKYADYFDIDFSHPDFKGKLLIPFLGKTPEEAIKSGEIRLSKKDDTVGFSYFDFFVPVNEQTIATIGNIETNDFLEEINSNPAKLQELLEQQHYKLAFWKEAGSHLNSRRFFTINSLISLRMENNHVFEDYHQFIQKLISQKKIEGLRIDHIDGLKLPAVYIEKLRVLSGDEIYIVAEKILERNENLESDWPLQGTTGYDFLAKVSNLFTYQKNYPHLRKFYRNFTGIKENPEEIIYQKKKLILLSSMKGDLDNLYRMFSESGFIDKNDYSFNKESIQNAIAEFLLSSPRYKLYSWYFPLTAEDREIIHRVIITAEEMNKSLVKPLQLLHNLFIEQVGLTQEQKESALGFFLRCMQFTGPLMAKGVEDTAMYYYNCFISHNEVGDAINASGMSIREFHETMVSRQKLTPMTMNATSTHDTKRGEDVRARLNVISELSQEWTKQVIHWSQINQQHKIRIDGVTVPSHNEEYFIYQTLAGIFPFNHQTDEVFLSRFDEYLIKSLREAKVTSDWNEPQEEYEKAVIEFVRRILLPQSDFFKSFIPFEEKISKCGIINSISQLYLKATCPGIPDFYQGTELWDFSLVDPDNRRPVDYKIRADLLKDLMREHREDPVQFDGKIYANPETGHLKLWLTRLLIKERSLHPNLFIHGKYFPLNVTGSLREHVLAFARVYKNTWYVVVIPLYLAILYEKQGQDINSLSIDWEDTMIEIPDLAPEKWSNIKDGSIIIPKEKILLSSIMQIPYPCLLRGSKQITTRKAGILLHVTSLPGKYGTGDLGEEARKFVDHLWESGQSFWQILPLNPIGEGSDYSPYSTHSGFAGNLMLINPDYLVKIKLVNSDTLSKMTFLDSNKCDFKKAGEFRAAVLEEAYSVFSQYPRHYLREKFAEFCQQNNYWLDDYALYASLKTIYQGKPWIEWPKTIAERVSGEMEELKKKNKTEIDKYKFWQFLFSVQWKSLKEYTNHNGIKIIGDIPFYVNYDSVEVWQNPHLFKLDRKMMMISVAGVPPDYFSREGQLWNMPVYHWENMKKDDFTWWRNRIRKNLEYCDIVRFDHFRGFSAFWEVKAGEKTAVKGKWKSAPGYALFRKVKEDFPSMPFIAEDLGEIDDEVYKLRDHFNFPGLEVLQFAFDNEMQKSIHIPFNHSKNSVVYTGTHDNNTIKGWYKNELSEGFKTLMDEYLNKMIKISSVHLEFVRMCYNSVSLIAVIPIQDILGLDSDSRLNDPGLVKGNWTWKLNAKNFNSEDRGKLWKLTRLFGRT